MGIGGSGTGVGNGEGTGVGTGSGGTGAGSGGGITDRAGTAATGRSDGPVGRECIVSLQGARADPDLRVLPRRPLPKRESFPPGP